MPRRELPGLAHIVLAVGAGEHDDDGVHGAFIGRASAAGCGGADDRHIRRANTAIKPAGEDSAEARIPARRGASRLSLFLRLGPYDGGRGAEKHQGLGTEGWLEKAEIRTENPETPEHCRECRQRGLDYHCVEHYDISLTVCAGRHKATNNQSVPRN
jgi:hypothetical protein